MCAGNPNILFQTGYFYTIFLKGSTIMIKINIEDLLRRKGKSKYWLCQRMNLTSRNINRIIRGETTSISFKYIEEFCQYLDYTPGELISLVPNIDEVLIK